MDRADAACIHGKLPETAAWRQGLRPPSRSSRWRGERQHSPVPANHHPVMGVRREVQRHAAFGRRKRSFAFSLCLPQLNHAVKDPSRSGSVSFHFVHHLPPGRAETPTELRPSIHRGSISPCPGINFRATPARVAARGGEKSIPRWDEACAGGEEGKVSVGGTGCA